MLGIAEGHSAPEETAWAIRRFLEILASERPVIAVWEDVHWAEPALLDAIDHVADWAGDAPILLLCTARPEFLDSRPAWGAGKQRASALTLPPLPTDASTQLIANLLGGGRLPADAADRVAEAGGGNPLFVEQMVSMLIDDGLVVREDGGWRPVGDLPAIAVPPSVAALLAARLERLSDEERRAIGAASVIGKVFYVGAVRDLVPEADRADAGSLVRSLVRKELVRETRSTIPGEDAFEFRHILIRDAAYAAIPKERRAEQHRRFADWCVRIAGERIEELEEIVGYHLEQAFRNRESLGALDEEARALAIEASARLESAGMRAFDRPDMSAAANLLRRAETLLPPDDPGRVAILTTLAIALFDTGRLDEARVTVGEAEARASVVGDPVAVEHATIARWQLVERGVERHEQMRTDASRAIAVFEAAGDQRGLVRAWNLLTSIEWVLGQGGAQLDAVERALEHARGGTARYEEHEALGNLTAALVRGPTPVSDGIARAERTIESYSGSREVDALMCHALAHLRARLGEFDAARAAMDRYRSFYRDTGQTLSYLRSARSPSTSRCSPGRRSTPATSSRKPRDRWRSSATPGRTSRRSWGRVATRWGGTRTHESRRRSPPSTATRSRGRWRSACSRSSRRDRETLRRPWRPSPRPSPEWIGPTSCSTGARCTRTGGKRSASSAGKTTRCRPSTRRSGCSIRRATSFPRSGSDASAPKPWDRR